MSKSMDVYFKNENDAMSAQMKLKSLRVNDVYIEEMPSDTDWETIGPLFPINIGSTGSGTVGAVPPIAIFENREKNENDGHINYLLHVEVDQEDYEKVLAILNDYDCYSQQ